MRTGRSSHMKAGRRGPILPPKTRGNPLTPLMKMILICDNFSPMNLPILLAAATALATAAGGLLALKAKDRLHLVLGLAAGLLP